MTAVRRSVLAILRGPAASQRACGLQGSSIPSRRWQAACAALALSVGFATAAPAEEAAETSGESLLSELDYFMINEVTVTGSRIRRKTDFNAATPTTVVDSDYLQSLGMTSVAEAVDLLPSNVSRFSATSSGNSDYFSGSQIANLRGLNPYFGSRTLNLVNERRFVPTNQGDGVDLNFIPFILVDRVDIVTGGASAAYGSGAISGVNNVMLNRGLEGGRANISYGLTGEGDGDDRQIGLAYGTKLFGDRGHLIVGYERGDSDAMGCYDARDWCRDSVGFVANPIVNPLAPANEQVRADGSGVDGPEFLLGRNVRANQVSQTGVFNTFDPTATRTYQANGAGTGVVPFNLGSQPLASTTPYNSVVGGDGESIYQYSNLRAPVERDVAMAAFTYKLTPLTHLTADLSWGKVKTDNRTQAVVAYMDPIYADNAFLAGNADLAAAHAATAADGIAFLNKDWTSQVHPHSSVETDVKRIVVGLDGYVGNWHWDSYVQYGKTEREQVLHDNRHVVAYSLAIDSVIGPDGTPVCRIGSAEQARAAGVAFDPRIADGCVPLNPFGNQSISAAARAYAFGDTAERLDYEQTVFAASLSGDVFDGWGAGAIAGAVGAEYRIEQGENLSVVPPGTPDYVRTDYSQQYGESFAGKVNVTEAFVELITPILKDAPGAQLLELDTALRYSEYHNTGGFGTTGESRTHGMVTWKAALKWKPVDWLLMRATQSRDSRAANFRELYYGQVIGAGSTYGFCSQTDPCSYSLEGNVDLKPEKSDTTTVGFVFTPSADLQISADYFRIEIVDAIQQADSTRVLNGCVISGLQEFCDLITTAVPGDYSDIERIRALSFNGSAYLFRGIDFSASYRWTLDDASSITFRALATKMLEQSFQSVPGGDYVDVVGQTGTGNSFLSDNQPTADLLGTLSGTYLRGPFSLTAQVRHVSSGKLDYLAVTPGSVPPAGGRVLSVNHVPSYQVYGISGSYRFDDVGPVTTLHLYGGVDNLLDKDPPVAVGGGVFGPANLYGGTNPVFYDTLGRTFKLGLRATF